jgi:hypothetical protein
MGVCRRALLPRFVFEAMRHLNVNLLPYPALPAHRRECDLARMIEVASVRRSRERRAAR